MLIKFSFIYSYGKGVKRNIIKEKLNTQNNNYRGFFGYILQGLRARISTKWRSSLSGGISKLKPIITLESNKMSNDFTVML